MSFSITNPASPTIQVPEPLSQNSGENTFSGKRKRSIDFHEFCPSIEAQNLRDPKPFRTLLSFASLGYCFAPKQEPLAKSSAPMDLTISLPNEQEGAENIQNNASLLSNSRMSESKPAQINPIAFTSTEDKLSESSPIPHSEIPGTELSASKKTEPTSSPRYKLRKTRKASGPREGSEVTGEQNTPDAIIKVFQDKGITYSADVQISDPQYRKAISEIWKKLPSDLLPDENNFEVKKCIRCIQTMKDDASDVYAQAIEVKDIVININGKSVVEKGVFAKKTIRKGQVIGVYGGELLPIHGLQEKDKEYLFEFPGTPFSAWAIDGAFKGNFTRFMNHCDPKKENVSSVEFFYEGIPRVIFIASQKIDPGMQLMYDYGDTYWEEKGINPSELS